MTEILLRAVSILLQAINIFFHFLTVNYFRRIEKPSLASLTMKHIVILGGSYAGISTAHRIFKQTAKIGPLKITLVSPNTHFYWSMASPRGIVPGQLADGKLFQPIAAGFSKYSARQFEFILAKAESLDVGAKTGAFLVVKRSTMTISSLQLAPIQGDIHHSRGWGRPKKREMLCMTSNRR